MKIGKDGKICAINDNPPTEEEINASIANTPSELLAQWEKEAEEWERKRAVVSNSNKSENLIQ